MASGELRTAQFTRSIKVSPEKTSSRSIFAAVIAVIVFDQTIIGKKENFLLAFVRWIRVEYSNWRRGFLSPPLTIPARVLKPEKRRVLGNEKTDGTVIPGTRFEIPTHRCGSCLRRVSQWPISHAGVGPGN
jgi:hypothetical protein